jgi:hypothetical protein
MSKIEADNKAIKFPSHHYVGFQSRPTQDNTPLGFMTPDGTDAAAVKRKATVDQWAQGYGYGKTKDVPPAVTYENKPMVGFKLSREVRRYASFGNGNVKWRIEDPRGFELEISSSNFAQILMLCTMEKGEIQEQLIWGRLGSENVLVPVDSDAYRAAQANTERAAKKVKPSEVKLGDKIIMQNGDEGIFYGYFFLAHARYGHNGINQNFGDKKRFLFKVTSGHGAGEWRSIATPKIAEVEQGDGTLTQEAAEKEINEAIIKYRKGRNYGSCVNENAYSDGYVVAVSSEALKKSDLILTITEEDFAVASKRPEGVFFGEMPGQNGRWCAFSMKQYHDTVRHNRNGFDKVWIHSYDKDKIENDKEFVSTQPQSRGYYYGSNNTGPDRQSHTDMPEKVTQYLLTLKTKYCEVPINGDE